MKDIEVEQRGPLTKTQLKELTAFFKKNAVFKGYKERILIDYSTFLPGEGIKGRKKDIRLRTTNGIPEIMIKLGSWGGSEQRKEVSLIAKKGEFDKLVQIFGLLGLTKGALVITKTNAFKYKGIEFAVVDVCGKRYIFEAEIMIKDKKNTAAAKSKIEKVIKELELKIYTDKEFYAYIEDLNKKQIAKTFDYNNYTDGYFKKKFRL
jgi:adenylate cyclase class IV